MSHEYLLIQRGIVDSITRPFYKLINLSGTSCKYMNKYSVQKLWITHLFNMYNSSPLNDLKYKLSKSSIYTVRSKYLLIFRIIYTIIYIKLWIN